MWEVTIQRHEYQETRIPGAILKPGYHWNLVLASLHIVDVVLDDSGSVIVGPADS